MGDKFSRTELLIGRSSLEILKKQGSSVWNWWSGFLCAEDWSGVEWEVWF